MVAVNNFHGSKSFYVFTASLRKKMKIITGKKGLKLEILLILKVQSPLHQQRNETA